MEYWDLEQAKLKKNNIDLEFSGQVVLITGAASGIGRACVESFLNRGAAVIAIDVANSIKNISNHQNFLGLVCDLTDENTTKQMIKKGVKYFGGIDMVVLNAGVFPGGVVVIGSKNVPAPGPGAAAYSASKAALNQLIRVLSMEWGEHGIRLNTLHPNAVFDTGIWTDEVLESRANHYGISVDEYKTNNLLRVEIISKDVSELAAEMCGKLFSKTTAAQIPVDGGNERVI